MLLAWKRAGVIITAGYILGFPADTPQSIREDIQIIQKELPIDVVEFFMLTPLPGSEDHKVLWQKGTPMDGDMNRYDGEHAVTDHPKMSRREWEQIYQEAWSAFYSPEHMRTILRRAGATGTPLTRLTGYLLFFANMVPLENIHPLQGGIMRRKFRLDRRAGFAIEPIWRFYPKYGWETISKFARLTRLWMLLNGERLRIRNDPTRLRYTDLALNEVRDDEVETLGLFTHTDDARNSVEHARKIAKITGSETHARHREVA